MIFKTVVLSRQVETMKKASSGSQEDDDQKMPPAVGGGGGARRSAEDPSVSTRNAVRRPQHYPLHHHFSGNTSIINPAVAAAAGVPDIALASLLSNRTAQSPQSIGRLTAARPSVGVPTAASLPLSLQTQGILSVRDLAALQGSHTNRGAAIDAAALAVAAATTNTTLHPRVATSGASGTAGRLPQQLLFGSNAAATAATGAGGASTIGGMSPPGAARVPAQQRQIGIIRPNTQDILLGRGKPIQEHPGNEAMRALVEEHKERYNQLPRDRRGLVANELIRQLQEERGARFLKRDEFYSSGWIVASESEAYEKICHSLRSKPRGGEIRSSSSSRQRQNSTTSSHDGHRQQESLVQEEDNDDFYNVTDIPQRQLSPMENVAIQMALEQYLCGDTESETNKEHKDDER